MNTAGRLVADILLGARSVESWLMATTAEQTSTRPISFGKPLDVAPPAKLLDVPCGGGRHSLALAGLGYDMTGVDISTDFLTAARSQSAGKPGKIAWESAKCAISPGPSDLTGPTRLATASAISTTRETPRS